MTSQGRSARRPPAGQMTLRALRRQRVCVFNGEIIIPKVMVNNKYCVVPMCTNSSVKTPSKLFFAVPRDAKRRKKWMTVIKRADPIGPKSHVHCCEDHFDIENDMENYVKYKLVGGKLILKKDVVPHKFSCQKQIAESSERSVVQKRNRQELVNKILTEDIPSTSNNIEEIFIVDREKHDTVGEDDPLQLDEENQNETNQNKIKHKKIQVNLKNKVHDKGTLTDEKYFRKVSENKSNTQKREVQRGQEWEEHSLEDTFSLTSSINSKDGDIDIHESDSESSDLENVVFKNQIARYAVLCISREPQLLLGLPKQCYFCIDLLSTHGKCTHRDVMITLKKIRLHLPNAVLALDFGLSCSLVGRIFRKTIPAIASCLKSTIFFPNSTDVLVNLPITFRRRYSEVQSIIDCLEVQIEKPSNAVQQAMTWSEYKSCNTIKYLISITPDGLINFISEGYGGRTSDSLIFENCGILDKLPENAAVLADRGFKNISHLLQEKNCTLIRPPSVSAKETPTKAEVLETKRIAAVRIHVERSIGRLRHFGFIMPHACVDLKQIDILDLVVVTACGLVNLQNPLFDLSYEC